MMIMELVVTCEAPRFDYLIILYSSENTEPEKEATLQARNSGSS
jgi:hypothetical protein